MLLKIKLGSQVFKGILTINHQNKTWFILQEFIWNPRKSAVRICVCPWGFQASPEASGQAPQPRAAEGCKCEKGCLILPVAVSDPSISPSVFSTKTLYLAVIPTSFFWGNGKSSGEQ